MRQLLTKNELIQSSLLLKTILLGVCLLLALGALACSSDDNTKDDSTTDGDADGDDVNDGDLDGDEEQASLEPMPQGNALTITVNLESALTTVDEKFLSFAIDSSQVVGGHWWSEEDTGGSVGSQLCDPFDFTRPRLHALAKELTPAYLRIGGSEADVVQYDLSDNPPEEATEPFEFVFDKAKWDALNRFALDMGFEVFFTLNGGPGNRNEEDKSWQTDRAREWMSYTVEQGYPVTLWELGNEINGYMMFHGMDWSIPGDLYKEDIATLAALRDELDPQAKIAGPSSAFWPEWGEMAAVYPDFMEAGGGTVLDVITWHYYPQQSDRCPLQSLLAEDETMLDPVNLDEINTWADEVESLRDIHASQTPIWLGETGNAQCGGAIGISDRFVSSFWWMDELGQMARRGQPVVVRQTLSGSDYGMIRDNHLEPNPDYWLSVLWKRLMGTTVLDLQTGSDTLRGYAACTPDGQGVTLLLMNLNQTTAQLVSLPDLPTRLDVYEITASDLMGREVKLNGDALVLPESNEFPAMNPVTVHHGEPSWFEVQPLSLVFLHLADAEAAACRE